MMQKVKGEKPTDRILFSFGTKNILQNNYACRLFPASQKQERSCHTIQKQNVRKSEDSGMIVDKKERTL